jgi:ABC-2 type transport system ATP-binding protein
VKSREIFGLIGPNAAGKTTTLRILATLLQPTSGFAKVFGLDVVKDAPQVKRLISYLPEEAGLYGYLSGLECLKFMIGFMAKNEEELKSLVSEAAKIAGLGVRLYDKTKSYSKGMKRRLLLARALAVRPKLALLDEPTSGLDVLHAIYVRRIIKECARRNNITIIVSSHNMLEVEFLCDRMILLHKGRIVAEGTPQELKERYSASNLEDVFAKVIGNV